MGTTETTPAPLGKDVLNRIGLKLDAQGWASIDELRAFASARLAKFQVPRLWEFLDSLPKTPTQRVEKYKLRGKSDTPLLG